LTYGLFASREVGPFGRRQRHPRGHRVAVTLVAADEVTHDSGTVTVLDEFGADDVATLGGGCACCTVRVRLQDELRRLLADRQQGKGPPFSRIAIGSSQDPGPIRRMFASPRGLQAECYLEGDVPIGALAAGAIRFTLTEERPIAWEAFSRFMTTLMRLRGNDLLLAQGMLDVLGCQGPVVVQFEHHLASRPVELIEWPGHHRLTQVMLLVRNFDDRAVRPLFDAVRALV
jgi:G3E family GTPase